MSEGEFWLALAAIAIGAGVVIWAAMQWGARRDDYDPVEHEVDEP